MAVALDERSRAVVWGANSHGQVLCNCASLLVILCIRVETLSFRCSCAFLICWIAMCHPAAAYSVSVPTRAHSLDQTVLMFENDFEAGLPAAAHVAMVACGGGHTVVTDAQHCVWFCGSHNDLPVGSPPPVFVQVWPVPCLVASANVALVACGFDHSVLVLECGSCFAWGSNAHGQLAVAPADLLFSEHPR
jgi:hypothetical protein